ncbi:MULTISPECIES: M56 family metallopeptidase [Clostridium]|uniref:M56 family metallopeptidase n=1 Tax=Clostridium TaxID=1485 RepID=UPI0008261D59|nr:MULTISPECIES: M56 family metallopeptidase [Clostridium]PJI08705.1 Zn-dependent protease [Clostridium sp. CT7]
MYVVFSLFLQTIKLSIMASVAAIIIWLIKLLFKNKLSSAWHYYIWFIIIIRLLLPYSLSSPVSIYNTVNIDKNMSKATINSSTTQIINNPTTVNTKANHHNNDFNQNSCQNILHILSIVWVIVLGIACIYLLSIYTIFCFKIKSENDFRDVKICDTLEQCKKAMNIRRNIKIKNSKSVQTPCITGLITPVILIPEGLVHKLTNDDVKYIIIHELAHFKRKDILINWIVIILNLIHWFNPILYFSFKRLKQDAEISCDAKALSYIKTKDHKNYGNTIINLVSLISLPTTNPWEVTMVGKSQIKRRIIMISKFKKGTLIKTSLGIAAACIACVVILTNAKNTNLLATTKSPNVKHNKVVQPKVSMDSSSKSNNVQENNTAVPTNNSSSSTKSKPTDKSKPTEKVKTTTNTVPNSQKQNVKSPAQNNSKTQPSTTNNESKVNNSNQEDDYTPEQAAISAINYEVGQSNKISSVSKGPSGDGYSNFTHGDVGATVFYSTTENGKKYYSVRLCLLSARRNGGTGTIDNLLIAKDGTLYQNK